MRCVLFHLAIAASLVVSIGMAILWARSYSRMTGLIVVRAQPHAWGVSVIRGGVYVRRTRLPGDSVPPRVFNHELRWDDVIIKMPHQFAGFGYMRASEGGPGVRVPAWAVILPPAAFVAAVARTEVRRRRRRPAGCCTVCGYDLRATPERCPECGAVQRPPHNPPMHRTGPAV